MRPDGAVFCQGDDASGQSRPPSAARFTQIAVGREHGCGVTDAGDIVCWGADWSDRVTPAGPFTAVSASGYAVCGLRPAGHAECWGLDPPPLPYYFTVDITRIFGPDDGDGVSYPVELFSWPDGRLAVVNRRGHITLFADGADDGAAPHTVLDIGDRIESALGESGMLSAALDPQFDEFPFLYVYYSYIDAARANAGAPAITARLARFPISDDTAALSDELTILELPQDNLFHNGGAIRFGTDGMLYLGFGDDFVPGNGQDLAVLHGKIIRIAVRGATAEQPYRIPDDNPFIADPDARPEIWAYGIRNPWRMSFDQYGRLWVGDTGWSNREELSVAFAGANLGWAILEGEVCLRGLADNQCTLRTDLTPPVHQYRHRADLCAAITGALADTRYDGVVFFSDLCSGQVWALTGGATAGQYVQEVARFDQPVVSLSADANGAVYVLTVFPGSVYRLDLEE